MESPVAVANSRSVKFFSWRYRRSRKYDCQASIQTGDPRNFKTFDELLKAIKDQLAYEIKAIVAGNHVNNDIGFERVCPALSLSFYECIENAKDYAWGGAKYNLGNGIDAIGVADLINSVYAVKKLVFDDEKLDMQHLLDALVHDFVGYEDVQQMCLDAPKYGNDDCEELENLTADLFTFLADYIESFSSGFEHMTSGILPISGNTPFGLEVGALPSGRNAFKPLTDGVSATGGTDVEGMGAVIKNVSYIPHARFTQGTLLNLKLDPSFNKGAASAEALMSFLKTLCTLGVFHVQFNVVDKETLLNAQEHPEDYKGLLIRVAGYTAYFTELGKEVQDDIISRTAIPRQAVAVNPTDCERRSVLRHALVPLWQKGKEYHKP